jgi:hypothetical protein
MFRSRDGEITRREKRKALTAAAILFVLMGALVLFSMGAIAWTESETGGRFADRGHREAGDLIAFAALKPFTGGALWWYLLAASVHVVRLLNWRCAPGAEASPRGARTQSSVEDI